MRMNFHERKQQRREEALERLERWEKLSVQQKIEVLNRRGHGHCRQAKRLKDVNYILKAAKIEGS